MSGGGNIYRLPAARETALEPFEPFYAAQMEGRVPRQREWLIDGVLLRRSVMLLAGPAKIGKSLLLQQLLSAGALGQPWLNLDTVQVKSFGLFTEDPQEELERRQSAVNAHYDTDAASYELQLAWTSLEGKPASLVSFDRFGGKPVLSDLWHQFWRFVADEDIKLVGLDNARVLFDGSEINAQQVKSFIRLLVEKAIAIDGAIVLAVHPPKADPGGISGSGAWHSSVRAGVSLHRPADWDFERDGIRDARRVLTDLGGNYGGLASINLEIRDGVFHVDEHLKRHKRGPLSESERMDLRYRLLIGLKRVMANGARVPADEGHRESMPNRARRSPDPELAGIAFNDLYRAQDEMLDAGQLVRVKVRGACLIRPHDGPYYDGEEIWRPVPAPKEARHGAQ